jgi:hypothetical protein
LLDFSSAYFGRIVPTASGSGRAGVDSVWEQGKLEARKMLDAERATRQLHALVGAVLIKDSLAVGWIR